MNLTSNLIEVEDTWEAVNDWFLKEKLSDGLPIVPPTVERVERMLGATARDSQTRPISRTWCLACATTTSRSIAIPTCRAT